MNEVEFQRLTKQTTDTISAKVICDSVAPNGVRLTTLELTYPRFIHSELLTHRKLSRNSASSRAIPLSKMIKRVQELPVFPIHWGKNEKGMQAREELTTEQKLEAGYKWMLARTTAIGFAGDLEMIGVHKQIGNRLLEPWMWITVIVSATNFENLFGLRCHKDAEPHFQNLSYKVREVYDASTPKQIPWGGWHLPYFGSNGGNFEDFREIGPDNRPKVSAGRCARVSYLTHDGRRDPKEDIALYEKLARSFPLHASPLEHPAQAIEDWEQDWSSGATRQKRIDWGNFDPGFLQFRKMHENENITKRV